MPHLHPPAIVIAPPLSVLSDAVVMGAEAPAVDTVRTEAASRDTARAMSQANVEIMREMFAIVNDRGVAAATDAFGHLLDPDFELEEAANVPDRESHSGKEAFIANMAKLEEAFEELRLEPIEFADLGDKLVVVLSIAGRGRTGGAPVEARIAQLWTLRNGRALSLRDYPTKAEALEAAGLSE